MVEDILDLKRYSPVPSELIINYVFGSENAALLRSVGLETELLSPDPLYSWPDRCPEKGDEGWIQAGIHVTRHKLFAASVALQSYSEIVCIDWDTVLLKPLPADLWDRLKKGAAVQAPLYLHRRVKSPWRKEMDAQRYQSGGAFWYFCQSEMADRLLSISREFPAWNDEVCMSYLTDELTGGWQGPETYYARGLQPYCYTFRRMPSKPCSEDRIFTDG